MKICFVNESSYIGKYPRDWSDMKTEEAWSVALDADRIPIGHIPEKKYDLGILMIPSSGIYYISQTDIISYLKSFCDTIAIMQSGPHSQFQEYTPEQQIWFYNTIMAADILFVHNEIDKKYYSGLTLHSDIRILPTLMVDDNILDLPPEERSGVMVGGNMSSWYNGFDSYLVANNFQEQIYIPILGKQNPTEESLFSDIKYVPHVEWSRWMKNLNKIKYAVHLMRNHTAGSFALNCAYLGIPCIGYYGTDTQQNCHPNTTVHVGDLESAVEIAEKLRDDFVFYNKCSGESKHLYKQYEENIFLNNFWSNFDND